MAFKTFPLDDSRDVTIYKRKGARSIRLSVTSDGKIRVSIPTWTPYAAGLTFAKSRINWVNAQHRPPTVFIHGEQIGKAHHLELVASPHIRTVSSRVIQNKVVVRYPATLDVTSERVQQEVTKAGARALRSQAETLLPDRLATLAANHGFRYKSVQVKQLKSRWGSCDQDKRIVLNLFLMQLPWELIDYVLLHELTHTEHLNHSPAFWERMKQAIPQLAARRKAMREHQPKLTSSA